MELVIEYVIAIRKKCQDIGIEFERKLGTAPSDDPPTWMFCYDF